MLPLRTIALPAGVPELKLSILTHDLYDHQDGVNWLLNEILSIAA